MKAVLYACAIVSASASIEEFTADVESMDSQEYVNYMKKLSAIFQNEARRRSLSEYDVDTSKYQGVRVRRDDSVIAMGENEDVQIIRSDVDEMVISAPKGITLDAETVVVSGDINHMGDDALATIEADGSLQDKIIDIISDLTENKRIACAKGYKGALCLEDGKAPEIYCEEEPILWNTKGDQYYIEVSSDDMQRPLVVDSGPVFRGNMTISYEVFRKGEDDELFFVFDGEKTTWRFEEGATYGIKWTATDDWANSASCVNTYIVVDREACVNETTGVEGCHENALCEQYGGHNGRHICTCKKGYSGDGVDKCNVKYCKIDAYVMGAGGASGNPGATTGRYGADGGGGAYVSGKITIKSGEELLVVAGEGGFPFQSKMWNIGGGAPNSPDNYGNNKFSGGGGGASGVWMLTGTNQARKITSKAKQSAYANQFDADATLIIGAGGGGGGSSTKNREQGGGAGGTSTGQNGFGTNMGEGGQADEGGAGGVLDEDNFAQDGVQFAGGAGAMDSANGGGGGGGWFGGGGGMDGEPIAGGGGGSSFINTDFVDEQKKPRWSSGDAIKKGEDEGDGLMTSRGRGGRGNGQRGQDGRVALIIDGDTLNPLIYETGAYIYKCE